MRLVYALQMNVGDEQSDHNQVFNKVRRTICAWVDGWYGRQAREVSWPDESGSIVASGSAVGEIELAPPLPSGLRRWTLGWRHSDDKDESLEWDTACEVVSQQRTTEFSMLIRLRSGSFLVSPVRYDIGAPRVIRDLARELACRVGESPVDTQHRDLTDSELPDFVEYLQSTGRRKAIILVSPHPITDQPLVRPGELSYELIGLADVYGAGRSALFGLTEVVGKEFSCYNGAVRLYYPRFSLDQSPYLHPLYLPAEIERQHDLGRSLSKFLLRKLASDAAARTTDGPLLEPVAQGLSRQV